MSMTWAVFAIMLLTPLISAQQPGEDAVIRQIEKLGGAVLRDKEGQVHTVALAGSLGDVLKWPPELKLTKGMYAPRVTDDAIQSLDLTVFAKLSGIIITSGNVSPRQL